jgi:hypothetical protein
MKPPLSVDELLPAAIVPQRLSAHHAATRDPLAALGAAQEGRTHGNG